MNKKTLLTILQIVLTVGILWFIFRDPDRNRQMLDALLHARLGWIFLGTVVFGIVELCAVVRWQILLRAQGIKVGWMRLAGLLMIGLFFNPLMPGGTGGDVVKIFYLLKEVPGAKRPAALLAVLMDRVVGLVALMFVACAVIMLRYRWLTHPQYDSGIHPLGLSTSGLLYSLLAIFGGSAVAIFGAYALTSSGLIHKLPPRLPLRDKLLDLAAAYNHYARAWRSTLAAFVLSIPVHLGSFTASFCAGMAFSEIAAKATLLHFWAIMPIINTIAAIPLNIGGTGTRELLFGKLLGDLLGISKATAFDASIMFFMIQVLWGLVGGIVYWFYRPTDHARLRKIKSEVCELGHEIAETEEAS